MSHRAIASNLLKLALLLPILFGAPRIVQVMCIVGIAVSLAVDVALYRREQKQLTAAESSDAEDRHVPLPRDRGTSR